VSPCIYNSLRTSIAALALAAAASALLPSTDARAFSFGGMDGHGIFSMGRGTPNAGPDMKGGGFRSMSIGHSGNSTLVRMSHGDGVGPSANRNDERRIGTGGNDGRSDTVTRDAKHNTDTDARTTRNERNDHNRNDRDGHIRPDHKGLDMVVIPGVNGPPMFVPSYADGGYTPIRSGLTNQLIGNPCKDKVMTVETTKAECINNIVTITGKKYYYCRTTKETDEKAYSFPAVPKQECDGSVVPSDEWLPEGWTKPIYEERGSCKDTGRTLIQYAPEGGKWMKITWKIYACRNHETQKETDRLDYPERLSTGVSASDAPPVKPGDTVVTNNI
jgi:hypothetical protein